ncbi:MAG TPA: hypothetical protein DCS04_01915 [Ruminococcaceae bacterium]|nr:hypothetical protein [Oscillospiraceae bacterium]
MSLKWIKGDVKPPKDGSYYLIRKRKDYITIDVDYYYHTYNNWERFGKNEGWQILCWAKFVNPDVPEELKNKINCWFGEDAK